MNRFNLTTIVCAAALAFSLGGFPLPALANRATVRELLTVCDKNYVVCAGFLGGVFEGASPIAGVCSGDIQWTEFTSAIVMYFKSNIRLYNMNAAPEILNYLRQQFPC